jgi:hypothetical protein
VVIVNCGELLGRDGADMLEQPVMINAPASKQPTIRARLLIDAPGWSAAERWCRHDRYIGLRLREHRFDETMLPRTTVPQHDTTTLVVLGLVALHPDSG